MRHPSSFTSWHTKSFRSSNLILRAILLLFMFAYYDDGYTKVQGLSNNSNSTPSPPRKAPLLRRIRSIIPQKFRPLSLPWYEDGLEFSCTGCSKCCQVDGDVWLAPEEVTNIVEYLILKDPDTDTDAGNGVSNLDVDVNDIGTFRKKYARAEITPANGDRSESWLNLKRTDEGSCIFLDPTSGACGIYDVRPIQCSTYPFWPSLLESPDAWDEECVLPDDVSIEEEGSNDERHWSAESGGCEGIGKRSPISIGEIIDAVALVEEDKLKDVDLEQMYREQRDAVIVQREEIQAKRKQAKKHWDRFPVDEIKRSTWYL